jgi:hypothetical protein
VKGMTTRYEERGLKYAEATTGDLRFGRLPEPRRRTRDLAFSTALLAMHSFLLVAFYALG